MAEGRNIQSQDGQQRDADATLEELFEHASRRPAPPAEDRQLVKQALHQEWQAITGRRRWRRRAAGLSIAAAAVLALSIVMLRSPEVSPPGAPAQFAVVEKTSGNVRALSADTNAASSALGRDMPVFQGQVIRTGNRSGAALKLDIGISLRVDQDTELTLVDARTMELLSGRVYVDTRAGTSPYLGSVTQYPFAIITARGVVRHIGTQYMVRMGAETLKVSVRNGSVEVSDRDQAGAGPLVVANGQGLSIDAAGKSEVTSEGRHGADWEWAEALGPGFVLDGRSMADFFDWVASETGLEVRYTTPEAQSSAEQTVLHGKIDLPARQALDVVLMTSDLSAIIGEGVIEISLK